MRIPINTQPVEGLSRDTSNLAVHGIFYTIQGEGPNTGRPAVFARLAGCNLQCPGCDTEYTSKRTIYTPSELMAAVHKAFGNPTTKWAPLIVITGGEPFRQDIGTFTQIAYAEGFDVQVETNGTLAPPFGMHPSTQVVVSPKNGRVHPRIAMMATAWKYVLSAGDVSPDDGLPLRVLDHNPGALGRVARPSGPAKPVYVQPADSGDAVVNKANLQAAIQSCMRFGYTLQLQIHKLINME